MLAEGISHLGFDTPPTSVSIGVGLMGCIFRLFYIPMMTIYLSKQPDWFGHPPITEVPK
jgi:hypothetical protein